MIPMSACHLSVVLYIFFECANASVHPYTILYTTVLFCCFLELELELIQTQMAQKQMLRAEVYAHAMRASQNRKKEV